ncbi:hypothetical protein K523DRAFT_243136 [Schizophyllum commune Tattone D]|nr:hypothetical protein K523DRAFT_243136 [Schizophyllum commune Tattone D]
MLAVQPPADAPSLRTQKSLNLSLSKLKLFNKSEKSLPRTPGGAESTSTATAGRRSHRDMTIPPVPSLPPPAAPLVRRISTTLRSGSRTEAESEPEDAHAVARRNAALRERGLLPKDLSAREKELDVVSPIVPSPDADNSEVSQARLIELAWRARQAEQHASSFDRPPSPSSEGSCLDRTTSNEWEGGSPGSSTGHSDMSHAAPSLTHTVSSYAPSDTIESPLDDAFRTVAHRIPAAINEYDVLVLEDGVSGKPPLPPRKTRTSTPPSAYAPPSSSSPPARASPLSSAKAPPSSFARHAPSSFTPPSSFPRQAGTAPPSSYNAPPSSFTPSHPTRQKLLSSTSLSNLRRSVVGSLSRAQRAVRGATSNDEPRRRTESLGSQAEWANVMGGGYASPNGKGYASNGKEFASTGYPSSGTASQYNGAAAQYNSGSTPVRRPSKASVAPSRRSNRSGSLTTDAPRVAVNPVMHSHATVMDSAAAIEDEESRKVTEAAFCY